MSFAHPHPANGQMPPPYIPVLIGSLWFVQRTSDQYLAAFDGTVGSGAAYGRPRMWLRAYEALHFIDKLLPDSKTLLWIPRP